ncbi:MAG: PH domain-containing protein [Firmicutes bacterium]|nr:PH domain-containing protein [Bacillota bacterium]
MGIFRGLMGHASEMDIEKIEKDFELILIEGEEVEKAYKVLRDLFVFTNKRLILLDKQGMTGKKSEYRSIPYRSITYFSVESAGHFDLDAELKIYVRGMNTPIQKEFKKDKNIYDVQKALANYVL